LVAEAPGCGRVMSVGWELLREDVLLDSPHVRVTRETVTGGVIEGRNTLGLTAGKWL